MLSVVVLLFTAAPLFAQFEEEDEFSERPVHTNEAAKIYQQNLKTYSNNADVLVLPGLVANRKEKCVEVLAESTKIAANDAGEYLLVGQHSSHGYEALFWSFAEPSDIHKALEFIGLRCGTPRDPRQHRLWAKGEKVVVYVGNEEGAPRIEELIYDTETEQPLPSDGLIFSGSMEIPNPTGGVGRVYLADAYDPRSIIPAYNEPASVLDVPWQATKGQYYESHVMNPDYPLKANKMHTLVFEPLDKEGRPTLRDLTLDVNGKLEFVLKETGSDKVLNTNATYEAVLDACKAIIQNRQEPYVTVRFDDSLSLGKIQVIAAALMLVDRPGALRIEAGPQDRLYYRAFLPNPEWRNPEDRFNQAWELHVAETEKGLESKMVFHDAEWEGDSMERKLTRREYKAPSAKDIRKILDDDRAKRESESRRQAPPVLLVFVSGDVRYGDLLKHMAPALTTHNIVHLFLDKEEEAGEKADGGESDDK